MAKTMTQLRIVIVKNSRVPEYICLFNSSPINLNLSKIYECEIDKLAILYLFHKILGGLAWSIALMGSFNCQIFKLLCYVDELAGKSKLLGKMLKESHYIGCISILILGKIRKEGMGNYIPSA